MPRKIVELLHYETSGIIPNEWTRSVARLCQKRFFPSRWRIWHNTRVPNPARPNLLRRLALEFKRVRDIEAFNCQFREHSEKDPDKIDYRFVREVLKTEESAFEDRRKASEKAVLISISKEKYR